jgi:retron-type reverse transcriptase
LGIIGWLLRALFGGDDGPRRRRSVVGRGYTDDRLRPPTGGTHHIPVAREVPVAHEMPQTYGSPSTPPAGGGRRRNVTLSGLDASRFAPLSAAGAREFIRGQGSSWKNAYLDPLHVIPDESLPRIQLIDRAMVGAGLIAPEELAEIHDVGRRMLAARGDLNYAYRQAQAAVVRSQQEREALKKQKKREAAERRKAHAEAVARRKATDIVFLGRGVSRGLADRRPNVEKLQAAGLPVLATPQDVSEALKLDIPKLRWLAFHSDASRSSHYIRFTVPKKSGGLRALFAPHSTIAGCQHWILDQILAKVPVHSAAHGFVPGRSTVTNARPHEGSDVVVNVDLEDFFPTVTFPRVKGIFQSLGYSPAAATILGLLVTESPRREVIYDGVKYHVATGPRALPQGACTSPALSNLVARRLDARLEGISAKLGWTYTRYADDMTFSAGGETAKGVGYLLARVRHICDDEGFRVNEKKTRVLRRNARQSVTGLVVNERAGVPRRTVRRIRAILHRARHEGLDSQNRENRPNFRAWLRGMIAYISMVKPEQGRKLLDDLNQLN